MYKKEINKYCIGVGRPRHLNDVGGGRITRYRIKTAEFIIENYVKVDTHQLLDYWIIFPRV